MGEFRTVVIPACEQHDGYAAITVSLPWVCLECGGPRGKPVKTVSYDGSRRLQVHGWSNPCGHVEKYSTIRANLPDVGSDNAEGHEDDPIFADLIDHYLDDPRRGQAAAINKERA